MESRTECWSGGAGDLLDMSCGSSVSIEYHKQFGPHEGLLLLEADDKLIPDLLNNRVSVRGLADEEAVLCTPSVTYALKFVGTSNSVFLVPAGESSSTVENNTCNGDAVNGTCASKKHEPVASVIKVAPGVMELVQVAPRLDKLTALLKEKPFSLDEEDMEMEMENGLEYSKGLYKWEDIIQLVQASDEELMAGLRALSAVEIGGYWRILDEKTMGGILEMILNNCIIHDWPLNALREGKVLSVLEADGFPGRIVCHCLSAYGNKVEPFDRDGMWCLNEKSICLYFAKQILSRGKMKLDTFMEKWMSSLPSGLLPDLEILEGEVLYEKIGIEIWVHAFSVCALPSTPAERFAALFQERPKWEGKDLQPYIRDLRVPGLSAEGLLMKYTRRTQPTGDAEPIFSAR